MKSSPVAPAVVGSWLVAAIFLIIVHFQSIANLWFADPDDAMRLLQVRDWLAGQRWWDVGQHRLWGGTFEMHWSRIVDLPIAAVLIVLDPIAGTHLAERAALTIVPLVTLLVIMILAAMLGRRLGGEAIAGLAMVLVPLSSPIVAQAQPMRIDHHGWQIALALAAVVAVTARPATRSGMGAGAALAALLTISFEGLPIAATILGVALVAWAHDPSRRPQALAALASFAGTIVILHVVTRGPGIWANACDAIDPRWIAAILVATGGAALAILMNPATMKARLALLVIVGAAAGNVVLIAAPDCLGGPFASLDPLTYRLWYKNVLEGRPAWEQSVKTVTIALSFPIMGLVGTMLAVRQTTGSARVHWLMMLAIAIAAFAVALLVIRASSTANAMALPGGAWLLHRLLIRARAIDHPLKRILATAGAFLATVPGPIASLAMGSAIARPSTSPGLPGGTAVCHDGREVADLNRLSPSTLFAPLDVTPSILTRTRHRAIASGYHRNDAAIAYVMATFTASPAQALRAVRKVGAEYVIGCPGLRESELYKAAAPDGLWARLERGETISGLRRVWLPGSPVLVWRVERTARPI